MNGYLKIKIRLVVMTFLVVTLSVFGGTAAASEPVAIPDPNLEQAIRDELDQPTEDITMEDMERIIDLDARGRGIEDLTGLEYAVNLEALGLSRNQVSDIRVLENLENLEWLHLSENQISDVVPLQNLSKLEWLAFNDNQVSDIGVLEYLTNLKQLFFGNNQVSDITAVGNLTNLDRVLFPDNQVSDISVLENLTTLRYLDFSSNQVSEITSLGGLTNLERLLFPDNQVSEIGVLENLTNLQELDVRFNGLDTTRDSDTMMLIQQFIQDGINVAYLPQVEIPVDEVIDKGAEHVKMTIGDFAYEIDGALVVPAMDVAPFIEDGRTFVPARFLAEAFAAAADWTPKDAKVETVYLERADVLITISIGQATLEIYDKMVDETETVAIDAPARIVEGRTFLPFRAIGEAFGVEVDYAADPETGLVEQVWFTQKRYPEALEPIPEADPRIGESVVEGEVLAIDKENRLVEIEIHWGPDTPDIEPFITIAEDALLRLYVDGHMEEALTMSDLEVGMVTSYILKEDLEARAVIVHEYTDL